MPNYHSSLTDAISSKKFGRPEAYSAIAISMAIIMVTLLLTFVVPSLQGNFRDMLHNAKLPWLAQQAINLSNLLSRNPTSSLITFLALGALAAIFFAFIVRELRLLKR